MRYLAIIAFPLLVSVLTISACQKLENNIEIELESGPNELTVECYLEAGQPYRLMLTETKDYFDVVNICPFVRHAIVVITHNGVRDTLKEAEYSGNGCSSIMPYFNTDSTRFFNYGSDVICPTNFSHDFVLEVWDTLNDRYATASTKFIPPVDINTFRVEFKDATLAYCLLGCPDNPNTEDFYRMTLHKSSLFMRDEQSMFNYVAKNPFIDQVMYDKGMFAGEDILHASGYDFYHTDTIIGTVYHIDKAYHDYLLTSRNAEEANWSPFVEPSVVLTNIQGGHGIFTFLSFDRDTIYVP